MKRASIIGATGVLMLAFVLCGAWAQNGPCNTVSSCLSFLNPSAARSDGSINEDAERAFKLLRPFGEEAKQELLKRASGKDRGWREFSQSILADWHDWSTEDIPLLRDALRRSPGGWAAIGLGEIGTPEAIQALVADLPKNDSGNQTDFALKELGSKAMPYLMPLLESDATSRSAERVIGEMGEVAIAAVPSWVHTALDTSKSESVRCAALKAIAAVGTSARPQSNQLKTLLTDPNPTVREAAHKTLIDIRNSAVVLELSRDCHPTADAFDAHAIMPLFCLNRIAEVGVDGRDAGPDLVPFLTSKNGAERAYAIGTFAAIDYDPVIPQIEAALHDPDWRVVLSAIDALKRLDDQSAISLLRDVSTQHWFDQIRERALAAEVALEAGAKPEDSGNDRVVDRSQPEVRDLPACVSKRWKWKENSFTMHAARDSGDLKMPYQGGTIVGTNHGEWGGLLSWSLPGKTPIELNKDNVNAILPDGDGIIALFGLAHISFDDGYVLRFERSGAEWKVSEVARLLGDSSTIGPVGTDSFAVLSHGRAIVFDRTGILGTATCEDPHTPTS